MASAPSDYSQWRPGDVVADLYRVLDVITTGGMGLVYQVRHLGWQVDLAVKVPRPELVSSPEGMSSFEAEAESWVDLGSFPHIVNCAYVRRLDGLPRIFAEWVDGGSLAEAIRERRIYAGGPATSLQRVLDVSIQAAWGVGYAHRKGLVHQDLKPANVLLSGDGTVKVTDFGLARARAAAGERSRTSGTDSLLVSLGGLTPAYCSPEQIQALTGRAELTRATDVWSWAVSVLQMLAGRPPVVPGPRAADWLEQVCADGVTRYLPPPPESLVALLRRCFAAEPADRPTQMSYIADELTAIYAREVGQPYPRQPPSEATLLADGLSNQALSMLDLGYPERADQLWERALAADPHHPHAVYNRGLRRWRTGQRTDTELIAELMEVSASHDRDWIDESLLALVHLERADTAQARELLAAAVRAGAPRAELATALTQAEAPTGFQTPATLVVPAGSTTMLAVAADGHRAVAAGNDTIHIWEPPTGRLLWTLAVRSGPVEAVALSADGRLLAAIDEDGSVQIWDADSGCYLRRLDDPGGQIESVAVGPDARPVVTASRNGAVLVWDAATGDLSRTLVSTVPGWDGGPISSQLGVSSRAVTRYEPKVRRVRVWDLATGYLRRVVPLAGQWRALSADGRYVLADADSTTELWDLATGRRVATSAWSHPWEPPVAVDCVAGWALACTTTGVQLRELPGGQCLRTLVGEDGPAHAVAVSADGRYGLAGGPGATLRAWRLLPAGPRAPWSHPRPRGAGELSKAAELVALAMDRADQLTERRQWAAAAAEIRAARELPGYLRSRELVDSWAQLGRHGRRTALWNAWQVQELRVSERAQGSALSHDGRTAMVGLHAHAVRVLDVASGVRGHQFNVGYTCAFSRDGSLVVTCFEGVPDLSDQTVYVWDVSTGEVRCQLRLRGRSVAVAVSTDGTLVASGNADGSVWVWEVASGRLLRTLGGGDSPLATVWFSADNRTVLAASRRSVVRVWDLATGERRFLLAGKAQRTTQLAVSASGDTLLLPSASGTGVVYVWDLATGSRRHGLYSHDGQVTALAISDDGAAGLSSSVDGTLGWWDLTTGDCVHMLAGHSGAVNDIALAADSGFALSAGADGTVRVWDLLVGRCLRVLQGHANEVRSVSLSDDARIVLSDGRDATVRIWELDWDYEFPAPADDGTR